MSASIEIVEVSPRDGLQNEREIVPTADKVALIARMVAAGARRVEVASFVHPARVPQMADAEAVVAALPDDDVLYIGLVLNPRGTARALATKIDQLGAVCVATDSFAMRNQGQSSDASLATACDIVAAARAAGRSAQITIGAAFGCPFEGEVARGRVVDMARRAATSGAVEVGIADTIGVAVPNQVAELVARVREAIAPLPVRVHLHNTRGTGIANVWAAVEAGAATIDASLGGIGGCPFAPNATGNVATEDVAYMLERAGIATGLDLDALIAAADWLTRVMARPLPGMLLKAGRFPPAPAEHSIKGGTNGMSYRLGVDVGGTFTDLLLLEEETGRFWRHKTPSTPADSSVGILDGVEAVCAKAGVTPADVEVFLHGTTVATNAVLEGKGARVGLIVTEGYRQIMQIARSYVPGGLAGWIIWPKPEPMAALLDTLEVAGRIDAQGREMRAVDDAGIRAALTTLKAQGVEALTVSLMNAYLNGAHERRVADIAAEVMPGTPISLSHEVLPEMQEYERTLTTVANAAVRPIVGNYVRNLRTKLRGAGMAGKLALLRSDGGLMSSEKAEEHPVSLLMSGPAGGVTGALWVGRNSGLRNILTLDVGGTSTDVALIENLEPRRARTTEVGHLSVRASSLDVKTVGAGGGSIAYVPELTKALRVGPQSAGAVPGPVAYGKGGTQPTVTDANVVLGYLPESLLGGTFKLDREGAKAAVQTVADALGIGLMEAARGIIDIVNENMFGALRMISVQQGYDPRDFALMGFGGAGPLHVNAVARLMNSWPAVSPVSPGVLCALGDATTRMRTETARSFSRRFRDTEEAEVMAILDEMAAQTRDELKADGLADADITSQFEIDVRYEGQAFEVPLSIDADTLRRDGLAGITTRFDAEHKRLFTFNMASPHELVNLRAVALGVALDLPAAVLAKGDGDPAQAKLRDHVLWMNGGEHAAVIYERAKLEQGDLIPGPAIVVEMDSTTLIELGCVGTVDAVGNILITLR